MSEQQPVEKTNGPIASRRSHRKSRLGCANCKRRRIKCDEKRPACSNCVKHSIQCDFVSAAPASSRSAASSPASPADHLSPHDAIRPVPGPRTPSGLGGVPSPFTDYSQTTSPPLAPQPGTLTNVSDLELLHNYSTSTAYTISNVPDMQTFYRVNVPQIGFSYPFVLHAVIALSARHMAHFRQTRRASYNAKGDHHWEVALRSASALLPTVNEVNGPALYIFAIISCFYTLANGPKERDFLVFGDHGLSEWLVLFRGVRSVMETAGRSLTDGALAPLFTAALHRVQKWTDHDLAHEHPAIAELRELTRDIAAENPNLNTYVNAIDDLSRCYGCIFDLEGNSITGHSQTVFIWLYRVSDDYVLCLQQRQPMALTIFAYFVVLMNELGSLWWLNGWVYHLIAGIYDALDEGSRPWIRWPIEKLGWVPDSY